jgi:hypothetical protein
MARHMKTRVLAIAGVVLAVAGVVLAVAGCGQVTPLGPTRDPGPTTSVQSTPMSAGTPVKLYKLGSPITLQAMRSQSPTPSGGCGAGLVEVFLPPGAAPMPCFRPVGAPVTVTTATISAVSRYRPTPPPGQPTPPASYGFVIGVPAAQVAAVTALITQAYDARGAVGVSVDGRLWQAAMVLEPFPGQQLQISLQSRDQALQLYRLLVPSG